MTERTCLTCAYCQKDGAAARHGFCRVLPPQSTDHGITVSLTRLACKEYRKDKHEADRT